VEVTTGDRRYCVLDASDCHVGDKAYFDQLVKCFEDPLTGLHFYHYSLKVDIGDWNSQRIPETEARRDMKENSLKTPVAFLLAIAKGEVDGYAKRVEDEGVERQELKVTLERLYEQYKEYCVTHGIQAVTQAANFNKQVANVLGKESVKDANGNVWGKKYMRDGRKTLMGYHLRLDQFVEKVKQYTKLEVPVASAANVSAVDVIDDDEWD